MSGMLLSKCTPTSSINNLLILSSKKESSDVSKINMIGRTLQVSLGKCGIKSYRSRSSKVFSNCSMGRISFRSLKMVSKAPGTLVNGQISPNISKSWKNTATKDKVIKICITLSFSKRAFTKLFLKSEIRDIWMPTDILRRLERFLTQRLRRFLENRMAELIN